jgi:hypothetical protein
MKTASLALLLCLTSATFCASQEPAPEAKIVLVAPSTARVGELVRLDVTESTADSFEWLLVPNSKDFEVYEGGARAVFSARMEGDYVFIVACAKGGTVDVVRHVIHVKGPPPMPQENNLEEWIPFWNWVEMLPRDQCADVAAAYELVANDADLQTVDQWLAETSKLVREALGDNLEEWKPMLDKIGVAARNKLQEKAATNGVTTEIMREIWLEIARGLKNC